MVNEIENTNTATADQPITPEEIAAVRDQLLQNVNLDEIKGKNSAVLTVMMPLPLRFLIDEAAKNEDGTEGSAADWARNLFARELGYTLPTKTATRSTKNKRDVEVQQKAQRAMISELIERARRGEIEL